MAMIRVEPVEVHVRTGWFDGSPERSPGATSVSPSPASPPSAKRPPPIRSSPGRGPCSRSRPPARGSPSPISIAPVAGRSRPSTRSGARPDAWGYCGTRLERAAHPLGTVGCGAGAPVPRSPRHRPSTPDAADARRPARPDATYNRAHGRPGTPCSFRDLTLGAFVDELASAGARARWRQRLGGRGVARRGPRGDGRVAVRGSTEVRATTPTSTQRAQDDRAGDSPTRFLDLADEDADAYAAFAAAMKLPRDTDDEQRGAQARLERRPRGAPPEVPLRRVEACLELVADRRVARRPEQRQRLERPRRRGPPRRGGRARRRRERPDQPAVGRRRVVFAARRRPGSMGLLDSVEEIVRDASTPASAAARPASRWSRRRNEGLIGCRAEAPDCSRAGRSPTEIRQAVERGRRGVSPSGIGRRPVLAVVICGRDAPSMVYLGQILRSCEKVGIEGRLVEVDGEASEAERRRGDPRAERRPGRRTGSSSRCRCRRRSGCGASSTRSIRPRTSTASTR